MRVLSVIGKSKSGKTTTVESLIKNLKKRRYTIGSIKDIHFEDFTMDTPATNSHRHRQAGAEVVTARGLAETAVIYYNQLPFSKIFTFYDHDFVIVEGARDLNVPTIVCAHNKKEADDLIDGRTIALAGVIAGKGNSPDRELPVFDTTVPVAAAALTDLVENKVPPLLPDFPPACCGECGLTCRGLLLGILKGEAKAEACVLTKSRVKVQIGEAELPMVPFVQAALAGIIRGYLATLEGYTAGKNIDIHIQAPATE